MPREVPSGGDPSPPSGGAGRSRDLLAVEHAGGEAGVPPSLLLNRPAPGAGPAASREAPNFSDLPPPPSALLSKLQTFLPQMAAANEELANAMKVRPPEDFDVECVGSDDDERRVEMDVGLGVVDLKTREAVAEAEAAAGDAIVGAASDDDDEDGERNKRPRRTRAKPREEAPFEMRVPGRGGGGGGIQELT